MLDAGCDEFENPTVSMLRSEQVDLVSVLGGRPLTPS